MPPLMRYHSPSRSAPSRIISVQPPNLQKHRLSYCFLSHGAIARSAYAMSPMKSYLRRSRSDSYTRVKVRIRETGNARKEAKPFLKIDLLSVSLTKGVDKLVSSIRNDWLKLFQRREAEGTIPGSTALSMDLRVPFANKRGDRGKHMTALPVYP